MFPSLDESLLSQEIAALLPMKNLQNISSRLDEHQSSKVIIDQWKKNQARITKKEKQQAKKKVKEYIIQHNTLKPVMPQRKRQGKISSVEGYHISISLTPFVAH